MLRNETGVNRILASDLNFDAKSISKYGNTIF